MLHLRQVDADGEPEEPVDPAHPVGVALRQVVVDGDDVHAVAGERIEVGRQRGDERLALAGAHFGDLAVVQHHSADQLDVEMAHLQRPLAGLANDGEGLRQNGVERLAVRDTLLELHRLRFQGLVAERRDLGFERVDLAHRRPELLEQSLVAAAEDAGEDIDHNRGGDVGARCKKQGVRTPHPRSPSCQALADRGISLPIAGIELDSGDAVQPDFEVQVRARRAAGRPHRRHPLPAYHEVALMHEYFRRVRVSGHQPVAVVDREDLTILGVDPASITLPLAEATTGVPCSAGKSIPSWKVCSPVNGSIR